MFNTGLVKDTLALQIAKSKGHMLPQPLGALEDPLTPLPLASPLARPADLSLDLSSVYTLPCSEHWAKVPLVCWTPYSTLCL